MEGARKTYGGYQLWMTPHKYNSTSLLPYSQQKQNKVTLIYSTCDGTDEKSVACRLKQSLNIRHGLLVSPYPTHLALESADYRIFLYYF